MNYEVVGNNKIYSVTFQNIKDHRELPRVPANVNLMRVQKATVCNFVNKTTGRASVGLSFCSWTDDFDWVVGQKESLARAMEAARLSKASRSQIWKSFLAQQSKRDQNRVW